MSTVDVPNPPKGIVDGETEGDDVPLRPEEKKRLNWENGLYLAPLTTVGNLASLLDLKCFKLIKAL